MYSLFNLNVILKGERLRLVSSFNILIFLTESGEGFEKKARKLFTRITTFWDC